MLWKYWRCKVSKKYSTTFLTEFCKTFWKVTIGSCPECSATGMGQFPICKLKWDLLRTSVIACTIHINIFSAPVGVFYVKLEIWKKKSKEILYNPLMGCFPFANSRFQMGVTLMGFAEHFGHKVTGGKYCNLC